MYIEFAEIAGEIIKGEIVCTCTYNDNMWFLKCE